MSDDLSMLPEKLAASAAEVAEFPHPSHCDHLHDASRLMRLASAELLRLARENAELHKSALGGYEDGWHALRNERDALRTELAKLKARIEAAPIVRAELINKAGGVRCNGLPIEWIGKSVQLLVKEVDKREVKG